MKVPRSGRWAASRSWSASTAPDGEEWWRATANRWIDTHVLVHWVEDGQAHDHHYELAWLRAEDVRRFLKT
jgi:hypothetical protein